MTAPGPQFETILMRAAVSGAFDPLALLADAPEAQVGDWAGRLSLLCEEDDNPERWLLNATTRRELLARLDQAAAVEAALAGAPEPADRLGEALRALLRGRNPGQGENPGAQAAIHVAIQFAASAPVVDEDLRSDAYAQSLARVAQQQQDEALEAVLPGRLFGRGQTVRQIIQFAQGGEEQDARPLLLTGIGGIGKSAMLASVVKRWKSRRQSAIVIDFDLPGLSEGAPVAIMREFTRHLETEWIRRGDAFASGVRAVRGARNSIRAYSTEVGLRATAEEQYRFLQSGVFPILRDNALEILEAPLLLILDSFETVGGLGHDVVQLILDLESDLRRQVGLIGMRTVISGREAPVLGPGGETPDGRILQDMAANFGDATRSINLVGLTPNAASAFLKARDKGGRFKKAEDRQSLARVLKGHPLALIVLERFARDRSPEEVSRLVEDLESDEGFSAEFAQAFVYTRILDRIHDPEVKDMAHPGLALREITPDLIRLVLAPAFGTGGRDPAAAEALFRKLSAEFWLVEPMGQGAVRHRPDLRRLMLPGMFASPTERDTGPEKDRKERLRAGALAVCRFAAAYYADGPPADDPARKLWSAMRPEDRAVEALYYRALAGAPAPTGLEHTVAAQIRGRLALDLDTLPVAWRAVVRAALGEFDRLTDAERATLSGPLREAVESAVIERNIKSGQTAAARGGIAAASQRGGDGGSGLRLAGQKVRAAYQDGDFATVWEAGQPLVEALFRAELPSETEEAIEQGRFNADPIWLTVLAGLATDQKFYPPWWIRPRKSPPRSPIATILVLAAIDRDQYRGDIIRFGHDLSLDDEIVLPGVDGLRLTALALTLGDGLLPLPGGVEAAALSLGSDQLLDLRQHVGGALVEDRLFKEFFDRRTFSQPMLEELYRSHNPVVLNAATVAAVSDAWPEAWPALRGLTPELYEPVTKALNDLDVFEAAEIAHATAEAALRWPEDLWFQPSNRLAAGNPRLNDYNRRFARAVVATADRCGVLGVLLRQMGRRDPEGVGPLLRIHDCIDRAFFPARPPATGRRRP